MMGKKRSPRFKRALPKAAIRLTERDHNIVRLVHRHRFLRSVHIVNLVDGSHQQILRRLQLLYQHGYLERPKAQLEYFGNGGSSPMVYGLGKKGGKFLKQQFDSDVARTEGDGDVGEIFLDHAILVADVMVAIELACRMHGDVRLFYEDELSLTATNWKVKLSDGVKHGVVPDRIFALEYTDQDGNVERIHYFLEADRGTMPVVRPNLSQTSFQRKLLTYEATWVQKIHSHKLGIKRFRVLTITTNEARIKSIVDACSRLKRGHGLFLFTNHRIFTEDPFSRIWQHVKSIRMSNLIDSADQSSLAGHCLQGCEADQIS